MATKREIPPEIKKLVYERDGGQCQEPGCGASVENGNQMNVHHVQHEQFGGTEDPSNLILLCDIHHKAMHAEFSAYYEDGRGILVKMNKFTKRLLSKIRATLRVDDGYDLLPLLNSMTGASEFRTGQLKAIRAALAGRDVLFVTPTGSGKSMCYQMPGVLHDKPSLVISPLKSLMLDQVQSIWRRKIPATYINSDLGTKEKKKRFEFIREGLYKFILVAPERFYQSNDPDNQALYTDYAYFVVDEAHSIDSWGKAFRYSYRKLGDIREKLGMKPVIALTASASAATQQVIAKSLNMRDPELVVTGFYRDNISIFKHIPDTRFGKTPEAGKRHYIVDVLKQNPEQKVLVFVPTIDTGKELQKSLKEKHSIQADFYHGRLDRDEKMDIEGRFKGLAEPESQLLISTSAFGMGIDIPNIRHIIHWTPALSIEDYYQQIGRAGRDGKKSYAHLLYHKSDESLLYFLATISTEQKNFKEKHGYTDGDVEKVRESLEMKVSQMLALTKVPPGGEWSYIINYFGETPLSFWEKHGREIVDTGLVMLLMSIVPAVVLLFI